MDRYNVFNDVHKGLRAFLYETALRVQQTDFVLSGEAVKALEGIGDVLYYAGQHALYIERFLFPFVVDYNPSLITTFKQQYQQNLVQTQRLRGMMNSWSQATKAPEKKALGELIGREYTQYLVAQLESLNKEDNLLNPLLWKQYNDAALLSIKKEIVGKLLPADLNVLSKWAIRGMSNTEIIAWMRASERACAPAVFAAFFNSAAQELTDERWHQIQEMLSEGTLVK